MDCRSVRTTIVMPVYDAHEHVAACLDSVLRNTELGGVDSLLVIDDASTGPDIGPLLESLAGMPGVRVVRNAENLGYRSEEHTSELQSLMRISYAVFCLKKKKHKIKSTPTTNT